MIYTIIDDETNQIITEYPSNGIVFVEGDNILANFDITHKEYYGNHTKIWVKKK